MTDYYNTLYRQVIKKLESLSTRPYDEKEENSEDFSCAVMTREHNGVTEYDLIVLGDFICATNQIKQRTGIITIQVDTHKLSNSYYLLQCTDRLTYQLCNASFYNYSN